MEKIDVHAHILPEKLPSFREKFGYSGWIRLEHQFDSNGLKCSKLVYDDDKTAMRIVDKRLYCIQTRLNEMKKNGVNKQVISTVPVTFNYWAKSEDNEFVARYLNDNIANVIRKWPDKFIGLGTVPMQNIELAIKELIRCRTELGMNGLIIGTHVNDQSYDDPIFEPFWKASVDYNMPLFIHPWDVIKPNRWNKFWLPYIVGMTAETTATALQLAFSGVFERHPKLKIILAHCGGTLPYINQRANHAYNVYPEDMCKDFQSPNQYLKQNPNICADTLVHDPNALELAINFFGSDSLLLGSDYPFKLGEDEPGSLIDKLSDRFPMDLKQKIFNKNAKRIFNID
uniref:2-amino-3-carboxymuconate-6-semialdehyde decarboxylase n=1 Tax=Dermatophagoides pteronyssinus TaxID=6956 RepID=A0A6P6XP95_DERPT|nr:2-amino-3-carboxymuconate-6-semialdehyde decarboxylase-like [Dermatophagoides pteronyssinus]